jgi:hypothetical protein
MTGKDVLIEVENGHYVLLSFESITVLKISVNLNRTVLIFVFMRMVLRAPIPCAKRMELL